VIVVDSSVWIALIRREASRATALLHAWNDTSRILVGDIVLLEVLRGARSEEHAVAIERRLSRFPIATMLSPALARQAAGHYRRLRERGITVHKTADLVIASYCIANRHQLLHQDRDFDPFAEHCGLLLA
jgi:hypothetical protein